MKTFNLKPLFHYLSILPPQDIDRQLEARREALAKEALASGGASPLSLTDLGPSSSQVIILYPVNNHISDQQYYIWSIILCLIYNDLYSFQPPTSAAASSSASESASASSVKKRMSLADYKKRKLSQVMMIAFFEDFGGRRG